MGLKYRDFVEKNRVGSGGEKPEELKDAGKIVWEHCVAAGLAPTLEYWWSGDGMDSGHNIVIHW